MIILIHASPVRSTEGAHVASPTPVVGVQTHAAPVHGNMRSACFPLRCWNASWAPASPRAVPPAFPLRAGSVEANLCQKGRPGDGAPTLRGLPRLPAEPEGVAAGHCGP